MKYVFAGVACLLMSVGLVWASSLMASCGNWSNAWVCRVAERVGGTVLAPGLMTDLYSGSRLFVLISDNGDLNFIRLEFYQEFIYPHGSGNKIRLVYQVLQQE